MKIAVITANVGGFDIPKLIPNQTLEYDLVRIDDIELEGDNRHKAKLPKMQSHRILKDYDIHIWIDSSVQVKSENFVKYMVEQLADNDIAIGKHNLRDCAYSEMYYIIREIENGNKYLESRYNKSDLLSVNAFLRSNNFPERMGLWACGIFARYNNDKVNDIFDKWWESECKYLTIDQPMFSYFAQLMKVNTITWNTLIDNEYFKLIPHNEI
jgi:hypothetical protein